MSTTYSPKLVYGVEFEDILKSDLNLDAPLFKKHFFENEVFDVKEYLEDCFYLVAGDLDLETTFCGGHDNLYFYGYVISEQDEDILDLVKSGELSNLLGKLKGLEDIFLEPKRWLALRVCQYTY